MTMRRGDNKFSDAGFDVHAMTSDTAAALLSRAILAHENPHIDTT